MVRCIVYSSMMVAVVGMLVGCASTSDEGVVSSTPVGTNLPPQASVQVVATAEATGQPSATVLIVPNLSSTPTAVATSTSTIAASPTIRAASTPTIVTSPTVAPTLIPPQFSYPIGMPGGIPGDGFWMRHGYATENTWFNPGYWHTGEDWYALEGDTAGAEVRAVADGEVVYTGSNYPGRVVIVRHADDLHSMYGHLDPALAVSEGERVVRGALLGTVLRRSDDVPNHLHFEIRTFLLTDVVNGTSPRYPFRCGPGCAPGPGYWPMEAPELPDALGWRNPTHVIAERSGWAASSNVASGVLGEVIMATGAPSQPLALWTTLDDAFNPSEPQGELTLQPCERYAVVDSRVGPESPEQTSATAYQLWYQLRLDDGRTGWVAALSADASDRGADSSPSSVRFNLLPVSP